MDAVPKASVEDPSVEDPSGEGISGEEPWSTSARPISAAAGRNSGILLRTAFLVSSVGDWIYRFVAPFLILQVTGSAVLTALAFAVELIPYIVIGLFAGVVADTVDRRRIMVVCDVTSAFLAVAIAVVAAGPHPSVALIYALALALACVRPFYFPAFQGALVTIIPDAKLSRMNAWTQSVDSLLGMLGPLLGAAFVAALGVRTSSVVNAITFVVSAVIIQRIVLPGAAASAGRSLAGLGSAYREFMAGMTMMWSLKAVAWGTGLIAAANLAGYMVESNIVYFVLNVQHQSAYIVGVVIGVQGAGALVGATLAPRLLDRHPAGRVLTLAMGVSALGMAVPAAWPSWITLAVGWGIEGAATSLVIVSWFTLRQSLVPNELIGRIVSSGRALAYSTIPVGAVIGGLLIGRLPGSRLLFLTAFLIQAGVTAATYLSPVRIAAIAGPSDGEPGQ